MRAARGYTSCTSQDICLVKGTLYVVDCLAFCRDSPMGTSFSFLSCLWGYWKHLLTSADSLPFWSSLPTFSYRDMREDGGPHITAVGYVRSHSQGSWGQKTHLLPKFTEFPALPPQLLHDRRMRQQLTICIERHPLSRHWITTNKP